MQPHGHRPLLLKFRTDPVLRPGKFPWDRILFKRRAVPDGCQVFPAEIRGKKPQGWQAEHPAACHERAQHPYPQRALCLGLPEIAAGCKETGAAPGR